MGSPGNNEALIWDEEDDNFLPDVDLPVAHRLNGEISDDDLEFQVYQALRLMITTREGATFSRLAPDVSLISVIGGQLLHHDRHLASMSIADGSRPTEHTWNLVIEGSDDQLLLIEVKDKIFEHFSLERGAFIYMNTLNLHMVSRKTPTDTVVIVQVDGFTSSQKDAAMSRLAEVLRARPAAGPMHS